MEAQIVETGEYHSYRFVRALARTDFLLVLGVGRDGLLTYASPAVDAALGVASNGPARLRDLVHPEDRPAAEALILRALDRSAGDESPAQCRSVLRFRAHRSRDSEWLEMDVVAIPAVADSDEVALGLRDRGALSLLRQRVRHGEGRLRRLMTRLHSAQEEERKRLAGEVHDVLGQALTALRMDVSWIGQNAGGSTGEFDRRVADALRLVESTIEKVRSMSHELRPGVLDHFGLIAALEWQSEQYDERFDVDVTFHDGTHEHPAVAALPVDLSTAVFRIFQEAFTNVVRHADATSVSTTLELSRDDDSQVLSLTIEDDGRGIDEASVEPGDSNGSLGILNMRERVMPWGGSVDFSGRPGGGTTVTVHVPLEHGPGGPPP